MFSYLVLQDLASGKLLQISRIKQDRMRKKRHQRLPNDWLVVILRQVAVLEALYHGFLHDLLVIVTFNHQ